MATNISSAILAAFIALVPATAHAQVRSEAMARGEQIYRSLGSQRPWVIDPCGGGWTRAPCRPVGGAPIDGQQGAVPVNGGYPAEYGYGPQGHAPVRQRAECVSVLILFSRCSTAPNEERAGRLRRTDDGEQLQYCGRFVGWVPAGRPCGEHLIAALERTNQMHLLHDALMTLP